MKFYDVEEIAAMFNVHAETIRRMLKSGEMLGFKMGGVWKITEEELQKYIDKLKGGK